MTDPNVAEASRLYPGRGAVHTLDINPCVLKALQGKMAIKAIENNDSVTYQHSVFPKTRN
jgi:hypothetical protein